MVMLRNVTNDVITLAKGKVIVELAVANLIPNKIAPRFVKEKESTRLVKQWPITSREKEKNRKVDG